MAEESIVSIVRNYLRVLQANGINAKRAILYGSQARGTANEWSDIDIVVIAPELDEIEDHELVSKLWRTRARTDSRIEPVPCGEREWETDDSRLILEVARREGIEIAA